MTVSKIIAKPRVSITNHGRMKKSTLDGADASTMTSTTVNPRHGRGLRGIGNDDEQSSSLSRVSRVSRSAPAGTAKEINAHGIYEECMPGHEDESDDRDGSQNTKQDTTNSNGIETFSGKKENERSRANGSKNDNSSLRNKLRSGNTNRTTTRTTFHVRQHSSMYNPNISIPTHQSHQCLDGEFDICGRSLTSRSASDTRSEKVNNEKAMQNTESSQHPQTKTPDSDTSISERVFNGTHAPGFDDDSCGTLFDSNSYNKQHPHYRFGDHRYQNRYNQSDYTNDEAPGSVMQLGVSTSGMLSETSLDNIESIIINSGSGRRSGIGFGNGTSNFGKSSGNGRGNLNNTKIALARQRLQKQKLKEKMEKKKMVQIKLSKLASPKPSLPLPLPSRPS